MISINNINKQYQGKQVLKGVSVLLKPREICALLGPNGAGKSTLIKILAGLDKQDSGDIYINGEKKISNKDIGFMIESPAFYDNLSVVNNLKALSVFYDGVGMKEIDNLLKIVGLVSHKYVEYKRLSMGMKQRLYFAYALMGNPKVLVLDEPFNSLDPISIRLFEDIIKEYAKSGNTVLISGHDIRELEHVCNSTYIINHGEIVYSCDDISKINLSDEFFRVVSTSGEAQ